MSEVIAVKSIVTPRQMRAARALLGWNLKETADASGIGRATIARFELESGEARQATLDSLVRTFEAHGIVFFDDERGEGVAIEKRRKRGRS